MDERRQRIAEQRRDWLDFTYEAALSYLDRLQVTAEELVAYLHRKRNDC
jgi:hypothetical protein